VIRSGMSLREAKTTALELGATWELIPATGEVRFRCGGLTPMVVNNRRKDAPRALVSWLRRVRDLKPYDLMEGLKAALRERGVL